MATPPTSRAKVARYRAKMRAQDLRPIQIWAPDVNAPGFAEKARGQARAIASSPQEKEDHAMLSSWEE